MIERTMLSSRLFKFRAWDFKNNKWLLGYEYPNLGGKKLSDLKLMQFTGILDINKKPIYEGDIVNDEELGKGIVVFQSGCFFMMYDADTNMEFLGLKTDRFGRLQEKRIVEILGNIYENPELL